MKKSLLTLLCLLTLGFVAKAQTIKITPTETAAANSSTTYVTDAFELSVSDFTFKLNQVNPKTGQIKVNATGNSGFTLYNTTAIPNIKKVVLTTDNTTLGTWYMKTSSDAEISTEATSSDIKGNVVEKTVTFTVPEDTDASYFHINLTTKGSGTIKFTSISISFEEENFDPDAIPEPTFAINGDAVVSNSATCEYGSTVTISSSESIILYTLDGTDPTVDINGSENLYENPIELNELGTTTIKAIAVGENDKTSDVATLDITVTTKPNGLAWSQDTFITTSDESPKFPTLNNPNNLTVKYTSGHPEVATVDEETGEVEILTTGTTTIRATYTAMEGSVFTSGNAQYTLIVIDSETQDGYNFTVDDAYGFDTKSGSSGEFETGITSISEVLTNLSFTGNYRLWQQGTNNCQLRFSNGATLTVATNAIGYVITSITSTGSNTSTSYFNVSPANWTGWDHSITFNVIKSTPQIKTMVVSLEKIFTATANDIEHTVESTYSTTDGAITFKFIPEEGVTIYHLFEATSTEPENTRARVAEGFTQHDHTTGVTVENPGTLKFYAEKDGQTTTVQSIEIGGTTTGIEEVAVDADSKTVYYNLQGVEIENPTNGLYIRRQGQKVEKVVIK